VKKFLPGTRRWLKLLIATELIVLAIVVLILVAITPPVANALKSLCNTMYSRRSTLLRQLLEHLQLTFSAMGLAILAGVSVGILLTRFRKFATPVLGAASVIQTIPSLALVALMLPIMGIGTKSGITALFLYALLPIMRNTYTAIEQVDPAMIEVGRGMGMTQWQILYRIEIPLCIPVVMAGIRTAAVICVGIATLCSFIGAGGLGDTIMFGLQTRGSELILAGVIPAILLALSLDGLAALIQSILTPRGLKLQSSSS
jgi:osmoprotectant transport system permease protein